jgi:hypothetical protein
MHPCPCCGYLVYEEAPGSYDICPICFWEDDIVQLAFPDMAGGANKCSLITAQRHFAEFGACELRLKAHVRTVRTIDMRDRDWRPLDEEHDRYLHWEDEGDRRLWDTVKNSARCLYYWRPDYWLRQMPGEST